MQPPTIFEDITQAIAKDGYCVIDNALPLNIALALHQHMRLIPTQNFKAMGVGC